MLELVIWKSNNHYFNIRRYQHRAAIKISNYAVCLKNAHILNKNKWCWHRVKELLEFIKASRFIKKKHILNIQIVQIYDKLLPLGQTCPSVQSQSYLIFFCTNSSCKRTMWETYSKHRHLLHHDHSHFSFFQFSFLWNNTKIVLI